MARPRRTPRFIPFQKPTIPEDKKKKDDKKDDKKEDKKEKVDKKKDNKKEEKLRKKEDEKRKKEEEKERREDEKKKKKDEKKKPKSADITEEMAGTTCVLYTYPMEQFQICIADTEDVMVAVMLESDPSDPIKQSLTTFAEDFNRKFKRYIDEFSGKVSDFAPAKDLVDTHFNLFLIKPIILPMDPEIIKQAKLNSAENSIMKVAKDLSKERGFFFTARLIEEVIKKTKMPRDKIVKAIFGLNDKGLFIAIDIEQVAQSAERRMLWDQMSEIKTLSNENKNLILEDLLVSTEDSRKTFLDRIQQFPKKKLTEQLSAEIENRKRIREERKILFSQLDDSVKRDDFGTAAQLLSSISGLSTQLYENIVAQEFAERAQLFSQTAQEMRSRIPRLRQERNEIINKAKTMEIGGKYDEAAMLFDQASKLSVEIGEMTEAKQYLEEVERMRNLKELASLREALK